MKTLSLTILSLIFLLSFFYIFSYSKAYAEISSCHASVSPNGMYADSSTQLSFVIGNDDDTNHIQWAKFSPPSSDFNITNVESSGGNADINDNAVIVSSLDIGPGIENTELVADIQAGSNNTQGSWKVEVSDNSDGSGSIKCHGQLAISIVGGQDTGGNQGGNSGGGLTISSLSISNVSKTSVKISWDTNIGANSEVDYGTSNSYGSKKTSSDMTTSHSITLSSLKASTTYHFKIQSSDAGGNSTNTGDSTFVTSSSTKKQVILSTPKVTESTSSAVVVDKTPPTALVDTDFSKPFASSPLISGRAFDDTKVSKVEVSLDDGANWLPAITTSAKLPSFTGDSVDFTFSPPPLDDGNYKVLARSTDTSSNIGLSKPYTMVIDRLPPLIGASLFSFGPELLTPDDSQELFSPGGTINISLSAVGGPTSIDLTNSANTQVFTLIKNTENGLWQGELDFPDPGTYQLTAKAVDGAQNKTEKYLGSVVVLPLGKIADENGTAIKNALVSVYVLEPTTNTFVLWDAAAYSQNNPQTTDSSGAYKFLLPEGRYYIQVKATGFETLKTSIFDLTTVTPVNKNLSIAKGQALSLGPLNLDFLNFAQNTVDINPQADLDKLRGQPIGGNGNTSLIHALFPDFNLISGGSSINSVTYRGIPTVYTFLNTWGPQTSAQLSVIDSLSSETNLKAVAIFPQETTSAVDIFKKRGGYQSDILSDPDGTLVQPLNIDFTPTHVFVDRRGVIKSIKFGLLTKEDLVNNLIN